MFFSRIAILAALASYATAQTSTDCDPMKKDCPADPALGTEHTWNFNTTLDEKIWKMTTGTYDHDEEGAKFTLSKEGESTLLQSNFYIFFGVVEAHVKMAKGAGLISSVVLESDDLDEIDWEWVGYNTSQVQSNFFGKGNDSSFDRGGYHDVTNADTEFHNYTTYWDQDKLQWWIDGDMVRELKYTDEKALFGKNYPQTPCRVQFSLWPAGSPNARKGTIEWAGGLVDWDNAPFSMTLGKLHVKDFHSGKEYSYGDRTGSWESIKVSGGNSTAQEELEKPEPLSLSEKWDNLGEGAHIGVYIGAAVAAALLIAAFLFFCLRQRRKGRLENALGNNPVPLNRDEMQNFQKDWRQSEWKQNGGYQQVNN
ncbi:Concanavalin A-like lectin/glucanases superfamily [Penicillium concentricum]|uniref:chitinase n=1 Tax=Penicillium concentricum TaxID=293559 RepID=A0A9W9S8B3_9EURO|nr:Concanavalin A-like lectin/glucanases superfamily [Penicillium concentricum]KAJ5372484.1 Concanavalin A-like lectin/glucanases superfamily [Penicillium concentricum]